MNRFGSASDSEYRIEDIRSTECRLQEDESSSDSSTSRNNAVAFLGVSVFGSLAINTSIVRTATGCWLSIFCPSLTFF
jgi:hypothetical protein